MTVSTLSPSPLARTLLELAERQTHGRVDVGGRRVVVEHGRVVDVEPHPDDASLESFLVETGRLQPEHRDKAREEVSRAGVDFGEALVRTGYLDRATLRARRRAVWLDRLVRGMAEVDAAETSAVPVAAHTPATSTDAGVALVPMILDALARRAAHGDAERVGAHAGARLRWAESPHTEAARRWSELGNAADATPVSRLLTRTPSAAARIAALVRAGLAWLVDPQRADTEQHPDAAQHPGAEQGDAASPDAEHAAESDDEPRQAPAMSSDTSDGGSPSPDPARTTAPLHALRASVPSLRHAARQLDPGHAPPPAPVASLRTPLWTLPEPDLTLDDPLRATEARIAELERRDAAGPERAVAWRELARVWQRTYGALAEATRAWREAAAADPTDVEALDQAAVLCVATGASGVARRYAEAAVTAARPSPERSSLGHALRRLAETCLRAGDPDRAREALREAVEKDVHDPEGPEWLARLAFERGELVEAAHYLHVVAARLRPTHPDRARGLLARACMWAPDDATLLHEAAALLAEDGFAEAAVTLLVESADATDDADARRRLVLAAAERAELAGRAELAAECLLDAFDAEPHIDLFYEPLVDDLDACGAHACAAVVLEELARACPPEQRGDWLTRSAESHRALGSSPEWVLELLTRALEAEPGRFERLEAVRAEAARLHDPELLADALERGARAAQGNLSARHALLDELAEVAEQQLGASRRALWARTEIATLRGPEDAEAQEDLERQRRRARMRDTAIHRAEEALHHADEAHEPDAARRLAALLRDDPDRRERAVELYQRALEHDPTDAVTASALERTLRLQRHDTALAGILRSRIQWAATRGERIRLLGWLAAVEAHREQDDASAQACIELLEWVPQQPLALARLLRAGRKLGDPQWERRALQYAAVHGTGRRERARAAARLAKRLEAAELTDQALEAARLAMADDPTSCDALSLQLRHLQRIDAETALDLVERARRVLGDSPPLLALAAQTAERAAQPDARSSYLHTWHRLAPSDPQVVQLRIRTALTREEDPDTVRALGEQALARDTVDAHTAAVLREAIDGLEHRGAQRHAADLACLACDRIGEHDPELVESARRCAEATGDAQRRVAALERHIARADTETGAAALRELAARYREQRAHTAELRTLLRVLALAPYDTDALDRLAVLYARAGDHVRLEAVLSLRLEAAQTPAERADARLNLAAAYAHADGNLDRAETSLWKLAQEAPAHEETETAVRAAGALVELGAPERGVELALARAGEVEAKTAALLCEHAVHVASEAADDPELALRTAERALAVAPQDGTLLLMFERLALQVRDAQAAMRVYDRLVGHAMGRHGRRALLYRKARWLERAGYAPAALDAYARALHQEPRPGAILRALERLAGELERWRPVVDATLAIADATPHEQLRLTMWKRAAELFEGELQDPGRALEILEHAWEQSAHPELLESVEQRLRDVEQRDGDRARQARARIAATLQRWAEQSWDDDEQAALQSRAEAIEKHG